MDIYIHTHTLSLPCAGISPVLQLKKGWAGTSLLELMREGTVSRNMMMMILWMIPINVSLAGLLQRAATNCNTLPHTAIYCTGYVWQMREIFWMILINNVLAGLLHRTATHCYTLQHTAPYFDTLQRICMTDEKDLFDDTDQ